MTLDDYAKIWNLLNGSSASVITAWEAKTADEEKAGLAQALVEVRKAEREILNALMMPRDRESAK